MAQSVSFFIRYAAEVSVLMDSVIIVVLVVILHRINNIYRWMQKEQEREGVSVQTQTVSEKSEEAVRKVTGQAEMPGAENVQTQTELLTAVLDEVFL